MTEYIERTSLLNGISSPEADYSEIIEELIYKHKLDFLHDNNEDGVRDFASDLIECIKNYIKTAPTADIEEVRHGTWLPQIVGGVKAWDCSECKTLGSPHWKRCPICEAKMDGGKAE